MLRLAMRSLVAAFVWTVTLPVIVALALAQETSVSPERELVDRYVPVAYLREQPKACAMPPQGGEPYVPLPVEMVIGNDCVLILAARQRRAGGLGRSQAPARRRDASLHLPRRGLARHLLLQ